VSRHASLPFHLYVNVNNEFLGPKMPPGVTPGIWHGVFAREHQILMCHVMLESGANWSGLPLHALSTTRDFSVPYGHLSPWAAMGSETDAWYATYLEGLACRVHEPFTGLGRHTGIVIDWKDGYSRYAHEHKPLNLINLDAGQFALLPNNYLTYDDKHFMNPAAKEHLKLYRRGEDLYWEK